MSARFPLMMLVSVLSFGLHAACDEEPDFFHPCPLSSSIVEACEAEGQNTQLTCVVTDHPMCEEKVCAAWENSPSFCTRVCDAQEACPLGSTCEAYLDFKICVPEVVPTVTPH